ncbi:uncharacterized protein N7483_005356 [Penicillium malachiteum]|uniref:uncharacterized protein n=1 Tax=Penicillium malachiteum TaxID=1324776 RepID=UPI002549BF21|nr:uncharacterized protein N7483_005356 [Penicillium malachiteum]KAJ5730848.1 hypothetical protein N7483_005356 [Penicillium malachiteum]
MPVIEITSHSEFLEKILNSKEPAVLDCYAAGCAPCKAIAPKINQWSEQYTDLKFYKFDVLKVEELVHELEVKAMPTFMFFKDGEKVTEILGVDPVNIEGAIKSLLLTNPA